ncbi:MAG TPA: YceI family protein [Planctomycetota bacterium]
MQVDPGHSFTFFKVGHQGVGVAYGRFNEFTGTVVYAAENLGASSVEIVVKAESVDTNNEGRDKHLRSPDFLNTKQFHEIRFVSSKVEADGADFLKVTGTLSLHGKEKELVARVRKTGAAEGRRGRKLGFEAELKFDRLEFGVDYMPDGIGHEITLMIAVEAAETLER